jgi:hypothetical protein
LLYVFGHDIVGDGLQYWWLSAGFFGKENVMDTVAELMVRRDRVVAQMCSIRSMRQGSVSEQYLKVKGKGKKKAALRGPYYVFCRSEQGRTLSSRVRSGEELAQLRRDVAAHKRFVDLCEEFVRLTERLGELERQGEDVEALKKTSRSKSRGTGK